MKSSIYALDQAGPRAELCKDVAAMAVRRAASPLSAPRRADRGAGGHRELKPALSARRALGATRVLSGTGAASCAAKLHTEWVPCGEDSGVLVITYRRSSTDKPFVVPAADPKGREVAVPVRSGDDTSWLKPAELATCWPWAGQAVTGHRDRRQPPHADQTTAARMVQLVPLDTPWIKYLRNGGPFHRVPAAVQ
ncbi:hypothetical protein ACRAWF_36750 [Streptomyces sp. L7]